MKTKIKLHDKKQLAEDIERLGGLKHFVNKDRTDQSLCDLFNTNKDIYGNRGSEKRAQLRNLVKYWDAFSQADYKKKVLDKFNVESYAKRNRIEENTDSNEEAEEKRIVFYSPPSPQKEEQSSAPKALQRSPFSTPFSPLQGLQSRLVPTSPFSLLQGLQPALISPQVTQKMSLKLKSDTDMDVDFNNPSRNGKWNFIVAEGVQEKDKKMSKLIISTAVIDIRDIMRYSVTISTDGFVVYAKSPIAPTFIIEDYQKVYSGQDKETILGHSVYATKFKAFDENQRTETVAYRLPYPVCTNYFNKERHETMNSNGVYDTLARVGTSTNEFEQKTHYMTTFYVELAFANSIVETKPADPDAELMDALKHSLSLSAPSNHSKRTLSRAVASGTPPVGSHTVSHSIPPPRKAYTGTPEYLKKPSPVGARAPPGKVYTGPDEGSKKSPPVGVHPKLPYVPSTRKVYTGPAQDYRSKSRKSIQEVTQQLEDKLKRSKLLIRNNVELPVDEQSVSSMSTQTLDSQPSAEKNRGHQKTSPFSKKSHVKYQRESSRSRSRSKSSSKTCMDSKMKPA